MMVRLVELQVYLTSKKLEMPRLRTLMVDLRAVDCITFERIKTPVFSTRFGNSPKHTLRKYHIRRASIISKRSIVNFVVRWWLKIKNWIKNKKGAKNDYQNHTRER
jgi:hypothetical protein